MQAQEKISIRDTFGVLYIGAMFALVMYGITTLQTYFYYLYYPKDQVGTKLLVMGIWLLDTLHVIFVCHAMHFYLVESYTTPAGLQNGTWSLFGSVALNVLMAFVVQCFFTQRIHSLCQPRTRRWLSPIIATIVFAHLCLGLETVVEFFIKKSFIRLHEVAFKSAIPFGVFAILSDILIALALCVLLHSTRTEFSDTNHLINKLIIYAINRCLLTSIVAVVEVIVFVALPKTLYSLALDFVIGKLYTNSLLASLNSRHSLRKNYDEDSETSKVTTSFRLAPMVSRPDRNDMSLGSSMAGSGGDRLALDAGSSMYHSTRNSHHKSKRLSQAVNV